MSIFIFNWVFLLVLIPVAFFWLRRAWRIGVKGDLSEVALKKGMPAPNAARYARHELLINLTGGLVLVGVLVAVLGFQALERDDWVAIAGSTLWLKFFASFALGRHAHGLPGARSTGGAAKAGRKTRTA
ncbi:hypothetical protein WNB94_03120 [Aquabacterium sp. A3]|uniref:hypothetical protein n=1 Tax=Aquabacterium sp. A3 TaxID=3132829 RepID=UPI0031195507